MKKKITILAIVLTAPCWLCLLFWLLPLGSIGPFVLLTWIVNSVVLPVLFYLIGKELKKKKTQTAVFVSAIPAGLVVAYLQFISYMPLTEFFGLDDFYWI